MAREIPTATFFESLTFNVRFMVPTILQGLFTRNRFWVAAVAALHTDPLAVRFGSRLREKHKSKYVYLNMLGTKTLLVMDLEGIQRVLDNSPTIYAEPSGKRRGMGHFQPGALTISRGREWKDRRRFNDEVLDFGRDMHRYAGHFLQIIRDECQKLFERTGQQQRWEDFAELFERIALQIIFGRRARDDKFLTRTLTLMMREANRGFALKKSPHFDDFYHAIDAYLKWPQEPSLVWLCTKVNSTPATLVANQIPHWMFAMNETLATNTVRALALVAAHREADTKVRDEMRDADISDPQAVNGLSYLEGCVQEAMRLWPTTPMLVRETVRKDALGDSEVAEKTQILILNTFNHRDAETHDFADKFKPEIWADGQVHYWFNHMSNGTQVCPGKKLALFIAKAVLATLLNGREYTLHQPQLDSSRPLPHAFNYFATQLTWKTTSPRANTRDVAEEPAERAEDSADAKSAQSS